MVKGLSESGSQRVSIIGSDMLLQLEWSIEAMSKLKSNAFFSQWQIEAESTLGGLLQGGWGRGWRRGCREQAAAGAVLQRVS